MDQPFDPHHKWLGIPPKDQPAHHYRLLGIDLFENDREVIDAAANRILSHLKDLAPGDETGYSQRLLNEVIQARLCLLNVQKKAAYDANLRAIISPPSAPQPMPIPSASVATPVPPRPVAPPQVATAVPHVATPATPVLAPLTAKRTSSASRLRRRSSWLVPVMGGCVALAAAGILVVVLTVLTGNQDDLIVASTAPDGRVESTDGSGAMTTAEETNVSVEASTALSDESSEREAVHESTVATDVPTIDQAATPSDSPTTIATAPVVSIPREPGAPHGQGVVRRISPASDFGESGNVAAKANMGSNNGVSGGAVNTGGAADALATERTSSSPSSLAGMSAPPDQEESSVPPESGQDLPFGAASSGSLADLLTGPAEGISQPPKPTQPVPSQEEREKAGQLVKEVFGADMAAAETSKEQSDLSQRLAERARGDINMGPATRYMLLGEARLLAVNAGNVGLVGQIIDSVAAEFEIDVVSAKTSAFQEATRQKLDPNGWRILADNALELMGQALAEERFDIASTLEDVAEFSSNRLRRDGDLRKRLTLAKNWARATKKEYDEAQTASQVLEARPDEPAANLIYGKYLCVSKGDWEQGIPMLANGSDDALKAVAIQDVAGASDAVGETRLGDAWYDLAKSDESYIDFLHRAKDWYSLAQPKLDGLRKEKVDRRLEEVLPLLADRSRGPASPWKPLEEGGQATDCYAFGPLPAKAAKDSTVLPYLATYMTRGSHTRSRLKAKPNPARANVGDQGYAFNGPAAGHVMYYVFGVRAATDQHVRLSAATGSAPGKGVIRLFVDFRSKPVVNNGTVPLQAGTHLIVVRYAHLGAGPPWMRFNLVGKGLSQAVAQGG